MKFVEKVLNTLLFLMFAVMFFVVLLQVFGRFIPGLTVPWTEELTRLSFVYMIALGAPLAIKYDDFARVDIVLEMLPLRGKLFLELIISVGVLAFGIFVGYQSLDLIILGARQTSVYLRIPMYFSYFSIPLCYLLTFAAAIFNVIERCKDFRDPQRVIQRQTEEAEQNRKDNEAEAEAIRESSAILMNKEGKT